MVNRYDLKRVKDYLKEKDCFVSFINIMNDLRIHLREGEDIMRELNFKGLVIVEDINDYVHYKLRK